MTNTGQRLRLHIAALSSQPDVFWVTKERFAGACSRHPELASKLEADWSWDLVGFDKAVHISDIVIGWRFGDLSLIRNSQRLKWIQLTGAGTEHLQPLDWLPRHIRLTNNTGVHGPKLAEFGLKSRIWAPRHFRCSQYISNGYECLQILKTDMGL